MAAANMSSRLNHLNVAHDSDLWDRGKRSGHKEMFNNQLLTCGHGCPCQIFITPFVGRRTGFPQLAAVAGANCAETQHTVSRLQSEVANLRFEYHCLREIVPKLLSELMGLMTPLAHRGIQMAAEDVGGSGSPYLALNKMIDRRSEDLLRAHTEILEIRRKYYMKKNELHLAQKLADQFRMISGVVRNLCRYDSMNILGAPGRTLQTNVFLNHLDGMWAEMRIYYKGLKAAQAASRNAGL